jgi:hypothetical protein
MRNPNTPQRGFILAAVIGALGGSIFVVLATKAIPRLMSQIIAEMMSKMPQLMLARMKSEGFDPAEICRQMRTRFTEPSASKETQSA